MMQPHKMPLSSVSLPRPVVSWLDGFFADILQRHAKSGDIYSMLREAYVLGAHHIQVVTQEPQNDTAR